MPIEIRELVIKASLGTKDEAQEGEGSKEVETDELLVDSVEQMLKLIKNKNER